MFHVGQISFSHDTVQVCYMLVCKHPEDELLYNMLKDASAEGCQNVIITILYLCFRVRPTKGQEFIWHNPVEITVFYFLEGKYFMIKMST